MGVGGMGCPSQSQAGAAGPSLARAWHSPIRVTSQKEHFDGKYSYYAFWEPRLMTDVQRLRCRSDQYRQV
jgi:hypothetical protein